MSSSRVYQDAELHSVNAVVEGKHEGALSLLALIAAPLHEHLAQALPVQIERHLCHGLVGLPHLLEAAVHRNWLRICFARCRIVFSDHGSVEHYAGVYFASLLGIVLGCLCLFARV